LPYVNLKRFTYVNIDMRITKEPIVKQLLSSDLKQKILVFLASNQAPVTERELSRILGVSHTAVNKAMKQLLDINVIEGRQIGKSLIWKLNEKSFTYPIVKELVALLSQTALGFVKNELLEAIRSEIPTLNKKLEKIKIDEDTEIDESILDVYLIGSVAEGTAGPESDIDVLIISEFGITPEKFVKYLEGILGLKILEKTGNKVSFHVYTRDSVEKNKPHWLKGAIERGIKVY
jgi:predicted nucleotidyltransferase